MQAVLHVKDPFHQKVAMETSNMHASSPTKLEPPSPALQDTQADNKSKTSTQIWKTFYVTIYALVDTDN
jgi:hypothetical protein